MGNIKKILFPYDLSQNAPRIIPYVTSVAGAYNSGIYLLHVVHDLQKWGNVYIPHGSMDVLVEEAKQAAEKAMAGLCEEELKGYKILGKKVISGDPATEILKTIASEDIDMVIMGTHGRKGLEHILMGSVAEQVVKNSGVPVMTINPYRLK